MRILQVIHGYPPRDLGGTELFARALSIELSGRHDVTLFFRIAEAGLREYELVPREPDGIPAYAINNRHQKLNSFEMLYRNRAIGKAFRSVLRKSRPDLVHIHHLTLLSTDLIASAHEAGIPVVMTLHDYWMLCQRGQFLKADGTNCSQPVTENCDACLPQGRHLTGPAVSASRLLDRWIPGFSNPDSLLRRWVRRGYEGVIPPTEAGGGEIARIRQREEHIREMLGLVDRFVAPSVSMKEAFVRFGVPAEKIVHSDYGIDTSALPRPTGTRTGPVRFGFLGSLIPSKGPHVLIEAYQQITREKGGLQIGGGFRPDPALRWYEQQIRQAADDTVILRGPIDNSRVGAFLNEIDILVVPSLWQENSPVVIHEAFACGVPVIASKMGGIPELITDGENGLLVPPDNAEALAAAMTRLCDRAAIEPLRAGIKPVKAIADNTKEYERLYEEGVAAGNRSGRKAAPLVTAVVLNYNTPDDTLNCIASIRASDYEPLRILVLDNGSTDGSLEAIRTQVPEIETHALGENSGCAGGYNAGLAYAKEQGADYTFLINGDATVEPDTIGRLVQAAEADARAGIVGALVCDADEPGRIQSAGSRFDRTTGRAVQIGAGEIDRGRYHETEEVDGVLGCALLVRAEMVEQVGGLAEEYFCYFEETDYGLRAAAAGWRVLRVGEARVHHRGFGSSGGRQTPETLYYGLRNHLLLVQRHTSRRGRWLRQAFVVGLALAHLLLRSGAPKGAGLIYLLRGVRDYCLGRFGKHGA